MAKKSSILLIEDNPDDAMLFQRALKKQHLEYPLQVVQQGAKAVSYVSGEGVYSDREKYPLPKLIVLDLSLPDMHGLNFLEWLRSKSSEPTLPVFILTGHVGPAETAEALRLGCNACATKPNQPFELENIVRTIHNDWMTNAPHVGEAQSLQTLRHAATR